MTTLSGTVRELACLALGHVDDDEPRCPLTDEQLVAELTRELLVARAAAGITDPPVGEVLTAEDALDAALVDAEDDNGNVPAVELLDALRAQGWALARVAR